MLVTLSEMVIDVRLTQWLKALSPMCVMLFGMFVFIHPKINVRFSLNDCIAVVP